MQSKENSKNSSPINFQPTICTLIVNNTNNNNNIIIKMDESPDELLA